MLEQNIQVGKKLIYNEDYKENLQKAEFGENSYEMEKSDYFSEGDEEGNDVLVKFECEEPRDYKLRLRNTPIRNYTRQIINKYNSSVFRQWPNRSWIDTEVGGGIWKDADGLGNGWDRIMRECLKTSQIESVSFAMPDTVQGKIVIRRIDMEDVVDYVEFNDKLIEAVVRFQTPEGETYYRWYDNQNFIEFKTNKQDAIIQVTPAAPHGYPQIPVTKLAPYEIGNSQISPWANSQKTIINYLSILNQEITDQTFTKFILSGVRLERGTDEQPQKITFGSKRLTVLEDPGAKLDRIGADISQAESIRKAIEEEEKSLYRSAGLTSASYSLNGIPESGISRLIAREDFYLGVAELKNAIEDFENTLLALIFSATNTAFEPTIYSDNFQEPDQSEELLRLRDMLALDLPRIIKNKMIKDFSTKFFNLSEDEIKIMEAELQSGSGNGSALTDSTP